MKLCSAALLTLFINVTIGQTKSLSTLPPYDCTLKKVMALIGKQTIIVSPDDTKGLDAIINNYCSTFGSNCVLKKEAELIKDDYSKSLFIIGEFTKFRQWKKFNLPVKKIPDGFIVNNKGFADSSDGIAFVDTNYILVSGNSLKALKDAQLALTGGHDLLITEKGKITFFW